MGILRRHLWSWLLLVAAFCLASSFAGAEGLSGFQFKADLYQRDLQTNIVRGKGNAWLKRDSREIWADQIEVDFTTKRATADGAVHIRDGAIDIWCRHASYNLDGEDAVLENVVLISGQLVVTGETVRRLDAKTFQVEEGSYSNCNVEFKSSPDVTQCTFDWKLYGKHFSLTIEEYAHVQDALIYVREIPVFYLPYLVAPVKSKRQTGLLMPALSNSDNLGSGIRVPFFWAISPWQDLTLTGSHFSKTGFHLGLSYRYAYTDRSRGDVNVFLLQRRFSPDRDHPEVEDGNRPRFAGLVGEAAINLKNTTELGNRQTLRQIIRYVSDPYYTVDYSGDLNLNYESPSLRSQLAYIAPRDHTFLAGKVEHHQSLLVSKDSGVDGGDVSSLPTLYFSRLNSPFLDRFFAFEMDSTFTNFYRPGLGYDQVPATLNPSTVAAATTPVVHIDPDPSFHDGDYIRTGRRLHLEPRLMANVPTPTGIQVQPLAKFGMVAYHFDYPVSQLSSRQYIDLELPVSLYLQKIFETPFGGYQKVAHVFQPRVVYAKRLLQTGDTTHPFYYRDPVRGLSNTRFDILDQIVPFEFMRFELINRFRRRNGSDLERFLRLQVSEQYNVRTFDEDPRFAKRLGPIELLGEVNIWRFYSQVEALYQIELTESPTRSVRENSVSSTIEYRDPDGDAFSLGNRIRINVDDSITEKTVNLAFFKRLPLIFNLDGGLEYSYQRGDLLGARLGLLFASKPRSCWSLNFQFGQDALKRKFVRFLFALDFGSPTAVNLGKT